MLATFPGISQIIRDSWRQYWCWNFTEVSAQRLFTEVFPVRKRQYRRSRKCVGCRRVFVWLAAEELQQNELDYRDPEYELLIAVKAIKPFQNDAAKP